MLCEDQACDMLRGSPSVIPNYDPETPIPDPKISIFKTTVGSFFLTSLLWSRLRTDSKKKKKTKKNKQTKKKNSYS